MYEMAMGKKEKDYTAPEGGRRKAEGGRRKAEGGKRKDGPDASLKVESRRRDAGSVRRKYNQERSLFVALGAWGLGPDY
jgi:hypothetical protein